MKLESDRLGKIERFLLTYPYRQKRPTRLFYSRAHVIFAYCVSRDLSSNGNVPSLWGESWWRRGGPSARKLKSKLEASFSRALKKLTNSGYIQLLRARSRMVEYASWDESLAGFSIPTSLVGWEYPQSGDLWSNFRKRKPIIVSRPHLPAGKGITERFSVLGPERGHRAFYRLTAKGRRIARRIVTSPHGRK